jgi:hypothetical protein
MHLLRFNPAEIVAVRYSLSQTTLAAAKAHCDAGGGSCVDVSALGSTNSAAQVALTLLPPAAGQKLGLAEQLLGLLLQQGQRAALQQLLKLQAEKEVDGAPGMQQAAQQALAIAALHLSRCGLAAEVLPMMQFASLEAAPQEGPGAGVGGEGSQTPKKAASSTYGAEAWDCPRALKFENLLAIRPSLVSLCPYLPQIKNCKYC